jgi:hypothetical protein
MRNLSPGVSDQGRHPGDVDRRSHGRALNDDSPTATAPIGAPARILLVRLRLIGDVVFTTPLVSALKRRFPGSRLTYLVEAAAAPVLRHNPDIDELIEVGRPRGWERLRYDWTLGQALRARGVEVAIDLRGGPRAHRCASVTPFPGGAGLTRDAFRGRRRSFHLAIRSSTSGTCWPRSASAPPIPHAIP